MNDILNETIKSLLGESAPKRTNEESIRAVINDTEFLESINVKPIEIIDQVKIAEKDYKDIVKYVSEYKDSFESLYKELGGWNLQDEDTTQIVDNLFDCYYGCLLITVKVNYGKLSVSSKDVYVYPKNITTVDSDELFHLDLDVPIDYSKFADILPENNTVKEEANNIQEAKNEDLGEVVKIFKSDDNLGVKIVKAPNGRFFNEYYSDINDEHYDCTAGPFKSVKGAEKMVHKHRPTVVEISDNDSKEISTEGKSRGHKLSARCIQSYAEDGDEYWSEGNYYTVRQLDDDTWAIRNNFNGISKIGPDYMVDDFDEYFVLEEAKVIKQPKSEEEKTYDMVKQNYGKKAADEWYQFNAVVRDSDKTYKGKKVKTEGDENYEYISKYDELEQLLALHAGTDIDKQALYNYFNEPQMNSTFDEDKYDSWLDGFKSSNFDDLMEWLYEKDDELEHQMGDIYDENKKVTESIDEEELNDVYNYLEESEELAEKLYDTWNSIPSEIREILDAQYTGEVSSNVTFIKDAISDFTSDWVNVKDDILTQLDESKKVTEAPEQDSDEYIRLCTEIEFQAEDNGFTLTNDDVKAIADKMVADKFFFNHDIFADDDDEKAWEEINSLIIANIEAYPNKITEGILSDLGSEREYNMSAKNINNR